MWRIYCPSSGIKAALDWQGILGTAADLLAFASFLWAAYEHYVKPKRDGDQTTTKPFLFISLRRQDGKSVQFAIGEEFKNKELFIEQFTRQVTELRVTSGAEEDGPSVLSELTQNEDWVRVQVRDRRDS